MEKIRREIIVMDKSLLLIEYPRITRRTNTT